MSFIQAAKMVVLIRKPKSFSEFVKFMAEARPLEQQPSLLRETWASLQ